jgi:hypothetical protein
MKHRTEVCINCGGFIIEPKTNKVYCSDACGAEYRNNNFYTANQRLPIKIKSATTGAAHELVVCVDLMKRGWHVFRAQSPSCPCDLIAMNDNQLLRIEVTTGTIVKHGIAFPKKKDSYIFDFIAVVTHNHDIHWFDNEYIRSEFKDNLSKGAK